MRSFGDLCLIRVTASIGSRKQLSEFHLSWWRSVRDWIHVGTDGSCDVWHPQQRDAAQWQRMMGTLQRVEQGAVSSQIMAYAFENLSKTRSDVAGSRLRTKDGERFYPKSWSGNTPLGGLVREVAAWLVYVDPKHEAWKLIQRITKGTLRATEACTDGRYAEDDKNVALGCELAVALASVTDGAARATVLKVTQTEPSHGSWHGKHWLTATRPRDIKREFLTGPRKFGEIMRSWRSSSEKRWPMTDRHQWTWVMSVRTTRRRHRVTRTRATTCHTKTCVLSLGWGTRPAKEQAKRNRTDPGTWHRGKGADEWTSGRRDDGAKKGGEKGSKGSKPDWYGDK